MAIEKNDTFEGRSALITGAASGIGLAIATDLAARGVKVVLTDLTSEQLEHAGKSTGGRTIGADLSDRADVHRLAREAGTVDILVNNAGFQHVSAIEEFDETIWDRLLAVMLTAPFLLIQHVLPGMYERGWGRIINIASVHGLVASPYKAGYVSAKHGILGLTKTVALEAGAREGNVTINAICPSYVRTPLVEKQIADQARAYAISEEEVLGKVLLDRNAVKRLLEPDEVAQAVAYLCADSSWSISGTAFAMDAGWLAH
ncbi:MAG: 3-hydroxybutyrate dehydrogenase [Chloroflexota bacterium]